MFCIMNWRCRKNSEWMSKLLFTFSKQRPMNVKMLLLHTIMKQIALKLHQYERNHCFISFYVFGFGGQNKKWMHCLYWLLNTWVTLWVNLNNIRKLYCKRSNYLLKSRLYSFLIFREKNWLKCSCHLCFNGSFSCLFEKETLIDLSLAQHDIVFDA